MENKILDVFEDNQKILCLLNSISYTTESFIQRVMKFPTHNDPAARKLIHQIISNLNQIDKKLGKTSKIGII